MCACVDNKYHNFLFISVCVNWEPGSIFSAKDEFVQMCQEAAFFLFSCRPNVGLHEICYI